MHEVKLEVVPNGLEQQAAERIARQNKKYYLGIEISRVSWSKWAKGNNKGGTPKQYSSLLINLTTLEAANEVVEREMVEGYQLKSCS